MDELRIDGLVHSAATAPRTEEAPSSVNDVAKPVCQLAAAALDGTIHAFRPHAQGVFWFLRSVYGAVWSVWSGPARAGGKANMPPPPTPHHSNHTEPHFHSPAVQVQVRGSVSNSYYCKRRINSDCLIHNLLGCKQTSADCFQHVCTFFLLNLWCICTCIIPLCTRFQSQLPLLGSVLTDCGPLNASLSLLLFFKN